MLELTKEQLLFINEVLIKARDLTETENFNFEKIMIDSLGSSDMTNYDYLLRKITEEMKRMCL